MMVSPVALPVSVVLSLLPFLPSLTAQTNDNSTSSTILQDLTSFLNNSGYRSFSNALSQANDSDWTSTLSEGTWTLFAPTDEAFSDVLPSISDNATLLVEHLSYHFVFGNQQNTSTGSNGGDGGYTTSDTSYSATETGGGDSTTSTPYPESTTTTEGQYSTQQANVLWKRSVAPYRRWDDGAQLLSGIWPNVTLGRTLLNASDLVQLEGGKSQVLAWTRSGEDGDVTVLNQAANVTVGNGVVWRNFFIVEIDGVLIAPGNVTTALNATNQTTLLQAGNQLQVPSANGTNVTAVEFLDEARGFTVFAPSDEAFSSEGSEIYQQWQGNQTAAVDAIRNHYVNGTTLYSPNLQQIAAGAYPSPQTVYSAGGLPFTFVSNQTGLFVSNGNGTEARVIRPDVLVRNGVIHIIDHILVNTNSEPSAASSAYESATSAATETSTDTLAVGILPIPTGSGGYPTATPSTTDSASESTVYETVTQSSSTSESSSSATTSEESTVYVTVSATPAASAFRFRRFAL